MEGVRNPGGEKSLMSAPSTDRNLTPSLEKSPEGGLSFSGDPPISACFLSPVPENDEERRAFGRSLALIVRTDPALFRWSVLLLGDPRKADGLDCGNLPITLVEGRKPSGPLLTLRPIREFLRNNPVELLLLGHFPRNPLVVLGIPREIENFFLLGVEDSFPAVQTLYRGIFSPVVKSFLEHGLPVFGNSRKRRLLSEATLQGSLSPKDREVLGREVESEKEGKEMTDALCSCLRTLERENRFRAGRRGVTFLRSAVARAMSRKAPPADTLRILMYHRVVDALDLDILAVTPFAFTQQMAWLREEGWQVLSLKEALLRLEKGSLPERAVAITFDDGYRDNYEEAFPILSRFGLPATVFPVTGFVLGESEHRRYRGRNPAVPYLTVSHIREMKAAGIDFGGHTHTHPLLPTLSPEAAHDEIMRAKKLLEEWTGEESTLFAYPNGAYGREHFLILNRLGYKAAFSVRPGANRRKTLRWELRRTEVSGRDSLGDFIQKMNGGLDLWHGLYQSIRGFYR